MNFMYLNCFLLGAVVTLVVVRIIERHIGKIERKSNE